MQTDQYIEKLKDIESRFVEELKAKDKDLFAVRQTLLTQGLEMRMLELRNEASNRQIMFMRQKIECALTCHPNAVKYLLEEALGKNTEDREGGA